MTCSRTGASPLYTAPSPRVHSSSTRARSEGATTGRDGVQPSTSAIPPKRIRTGAPISAARDANAAWPRCMASNLPRATTVGRPSAVVFRFMKGGRGTDEEEEEGSEGGVSVRSGGGAAGGMRRVTRGRGRSGGAPAAGILSNVVVVSCPRRSVSGRVAADAPGDVRRRFPIARGRGDGKTAATGDADDALARIHPLGARRPPAADPGRGAARAAAIASGPSRARSAERPRATRRDALRERGEGGGARTRGGSSRRSVRKHRDESDGTFSRHRMPRRRPQRRGR